MVNMRRLWFLGILSLVCLGGCKGGMKTPKTLLVDLVEVTGPASSHQTQYPGVTEAGQNANLSFKVMGTVAKVAVQEGTYVRRGQLLASIDNRDYATQLFATEAEYRQVKAECERVIAMHEEQAVSDNDYDKAVSGLERITAKLKNHQDQLADCRLVAPYDGYVGKIFRTVGESVAPGLPVMSLFTSGDTEVVINVPESEYRRILKSASYEATFSALPGRHFPLRLKSTARKASGNQLYQLRLALAEKSADILPGMSAMVFILHKDVEKADDHILVPVGALFSENGQSFVYLYEKESGQVKKTAVLVEKLQADGKARVTGALQKGDCIVASGVSKLSDGQKVKPLATASDLNYGKLL